MTDIKSMLLSELQEDFALRGLQKFRACLLYTSDAADEL